MLEKPDMPEHKIAACLDGDFGLQAEDITFLPLGADHNTAVYRAVQPDGRRFFVKLRSNTFEESSLRIPRFLFEQGVKQIIPPLPTLDGRLWTKVAEFTLFLYPYIDGVDGYQIILSAEQWREFGAALGWVHGLALPNNLARLVARETFGDHWRQQVLHFLEPGGWQGLGDPVGRQTVALLLANRSEILFLIHRAADLAERMKKYPNEFVLCHSDLHAGNLLIEEDGGLYLVDWDNPILAPRERDLMYIGGGQGFRGVTPQQEQELFYRGYGAARPDPHGLAYYRYERIIEDIAAYCQALLTTTDGGRDRAQWYRWLASNFTEGNTIEVARASDPGL